MHRFFRAVVDSNVSGAEKCTKSFGRLKGCYESKQNEIFLTPQFFELWRELSAHSQLDPLGDAAVTVKTKETNIPSVSAKVSGLNERNNTKLDAIWDPISGKPCVDRSGKVELLTKHWEQVFSPKPFCAKAFDSMMDKYRREFPVIDWGLDFTFLDTLLKNQTNHHLDQMEFHFKLFRL